MTVAANTAALPDEETLRSALASLLRRRRLADGIAIARREEDASGTFLSEIVTCRLDDGREIPLFCKYATGRTHQVYGHRGDVAYEAEVYRSILAPSRTPTVEFVGTHEDHAGGTWLVLEYLQDGIRVGKVPDVAAMPLAARWIGHFHRRHERGPDAPFPAALKRYDADYYRGWAERTRAFAGELHERFRWLCRVCDALDEVIAELLRQPQTIIHGEYYSSNILFRDGAVYPVDWESAAAAVGEIDLAMLVDGWPDDTVTRCIDEYCAARWPEGVPPGFGVRLDRARLYVGLRWLGDRPEWTRWAIHVFEQLEHVARRLELIE